MLLRFKLGSMSSAVTNLFAIRSSSTNSLPFYIIERELNANNCVLSLMRILNSLLDQYKSRPQELNINCTDPLGRTSLVIAIENESFELIEVLLEAGINVSDGLLHAISEDYVEAVELLLEWEEKNHKEGTPYVSR